MRDEVQPEIIFLIANFVMRSVNQGGPKLPKALLDRIGGMNIDMLSIALLY